MARRNWTAKIDRQFECERIMGSDYYDQCMCGSNGDHTELHRYIEEEPEKFAREIIGA